MDRNKREWIVEVVSWLVVALTIVTIVMFFSACGTAKETAGERRQEGRFSDTGQTVRDSIYFYRSDSIYIRDRGDTVYIDRRHTEYRDRLRADTLIVRDSVYVDRDVRVTETVEVNRLTGWQHFQVWTGRILAGILVLIVVYKRIKSQLKV
jgi:hypothetical protein